MKKYILFLLGIGFFMATKAQTKVPDMTRFVPKGVFAGTTPKSTARKIAPAGRNATGERDMSIFSKAPLQSGGAGSTRKPVARTAPAATPGELPSNHAPVKGEVPKAGTVPEAILEQQKAEAPAAKP